VRQGERENYRPEVYVVAEPGKGAAVQAAVRERVERLQTSWPGVGFEAIGGELRISIPERYRVGHEAHFAQVLAQFLEYLKAPQSMPAWERPNMIAKYYVSTAGTRAQ
jgi:hypothetical protein